VVSETSAQATEVLNLWAYKTRVTKKFYLQTVKQDYGIASGFVFLSDEG